MLLASMLALFGQDKDLEVSELLAPLQAAFVRARCVRVCGSESGGKRGA